MGFSVSWIAFKQVSRAEVLRRVRLRDSGVDVEPGESPFALAEIPTGWTIVYSKEFDFGTAEHLVALSVDATLVACQAEEHIMFSAAHSCTNSHELWSVWHDGQHGVSDLSTRGTPPASLEAIKARLIAEHVKEPGLWLQHGSDSDATKYLRDLLKGGGITVKDTSDGDTWMAVDHLFDAPIDLAAELTGYRHDRWTFDWGQPRFTKVERNG